MHDEAVDEADLAAVDEQVLAHVERVERGNGDMAVRETCLDEVRKKDTTLIVSGMVRVFENISVRQKRSYLQKHNQTT